VCLRILQYVAPCCISAWNDVLECVFSSPLLNIFHSWLKTHLFFQFMWCMPIYIVTPITLIVLQPWRFFLTSYKWNVMLTLALQFYEIFLIFSFTLFLFYDALHYKLLVTYWKQFLIGWFCRVLDVCCTIDDYPYLFSGDTTSLLSLLMSSLPHLTHLDISGTNLAGLIREQPMSHRPTSHTTNRCVCSCQQ